MSSSWNIIEECLLLSQQDSVRYAMKSINSNGKGILLLVDVEGALIRTVTDGDLRRLILAGCSLDEKMSVLSEQEPVVAPDGVTNIELLAQMNRCGVNHVVIIDNANQPIGIAYRNDIDSGILLSTPHLGEEEKGFVAQAFSTNWIAPVGPNIDAFEQELAEKLEVKYAVAVSSGTAALHLALRVLNVGVGDTVFCSSFTFVASANPIVYQGAIPVFIDSDPDSWNMSAHALKRAFEDAAKSGQLPKAVIVVNLYGQSADMDAIIAICDTYDVPVIEDAAESLGATYNGRASGTIGKIGIYSFNGNKIITTSGGGMLVSDDEALTSKAKFLSTQAREPTVWYEHNEIGYNYRMSNILAGIGRGQLRVLDERVEARRSVFEKYQRLLSSYSMVQWMPEASFGKSTRWLSTLTMESEQGVDISSFVSKMADQNIEVRPLWKPMHRQPVYADSVYYPHLPERSVSDDLFARGLCLPSGSNLTSEQQQRVANAFSSLLSG